MKFLARLATGQIDLWRTFWLMGTPLSLVWDVTGAFMVLGIGVEEPFLTGLIITLFTLTSLITPFAAVAIWRSASNYPREAWWQTLLAIGAKIGMSIENAIRFRQVESSPTRISNTLISTAPVTVGRSRQLIPRARPAPKTPTHRLTPRSRRMTLPPRLRNPRTPPRQRIATTPRRRTANGKRRSPISKARLICYRANWT